MTSLRRTAVVAALLASSPAFADDEATETQIAESADESHRGTFGIGAGYSPDDGFIAVARVAHPDLFHSGQSLSLSADVSALRQRLVLDHRVPLGAGFDLQTQLFQTRRVFPGFTRQAAGGSVRLDKRLDRATRVYVEYGVEHVGMDVEKTPITPDTPMMATPDRGPAGDGLLATIGAGIEYSTLDTPLLPTRGTRLALSGQRAHPKLGSDFDLARVQGSLDHARPLGPFTLRLHGHAGLVRSRDGTVPLAFRLQHDGHADVRGFALDTGNLVGDNVEAVGRAELELPVIESAGLSLAGWVDAGLRYNTDEMWGPRNELFQHSAGFGVIWRSPIGPMRFDVAYPLDGPERGPQFLFSLGGTF